VIGRNVLPLLAFAVAGCGTTTEKGGDHVPTDKTYALESLPEGATPATIVAKEYRSKAVARFVHVSEVYRVCVPRVQFAQDGLIQLQEYLRQRGTSANQHGLELLTNHAFATLQKYDRSKARFSARVSVNVQWSDGGGCDLIVEKVAASDFPFNHADFVDHTRVLLQAGQIVTNKGLATQIPVGFVRKTTSADELLQMQKLIASYLGYGDSKNSESFLYHSVSPFSARTWNVVDNKGEILPGDDAVKIYGYAGAWFDVLKPADLDRFHYYSDAIAPGVAATDSLLNIASVGTPPTFKALPGNRYLEGARKVNGALQVCFQDDSGNNISNGMVTSWLSFMDVANAAGIHGQLAQVDATFAAKVDIVETGCQLWVAFRTDAQYPFTSVLANGLYAHEGRVATANGAPTVIPVLYINTSNLSLTVEPGQFGSARHVATVLQHEYAHFLGFRHSTNQLSLQAAAGSGTTWTDSDQVMFKEFLAYWR
jgi:hypothetical protein